MLAPMVELSHRPLRELIAGFGGCDRYYTEMSSAAAYLNEAPYDRWFMDTAPDPAATAVQFYAPDADRMAQAIRKLVAERDREGIPLGGVDLNFGCSVPQIEKLGAGIRWMKDPAGAARMAAMARKELPGTLLSAKLRLGYEESPEALMAFCAGLVDAGVDYLVLHPRLKDQKFRRLGKWSCVRDLAAGLPVPVLGNGDVRGWEGYDAAVGEYGAAGVMIGREAARRPWIFALLRGRERDPGFSLRVDIEGTGLAMLELIRTLLPGVFHLSRARRFFFYYCDNLAFSHHLRFGIQNAPDLETIERLFRAYFEEVPADRVKLERA